ncbi:MAG: hypothetical protein JXO44_12675 [Clostridia bacterium]|nr:hypothetical protein [Clostridia bacterium]
MKKRYRVTTRGKIVFSLTALLAVYGLFSMLTLPKEAPIETDPQSSVIVEAVVDEAPLDQEALINDAEVINDETMADGVENEMPVDGQQTTMADTSGEEPEQGEEVIAIQTLEEAGFTVYYEPNAYYVPEGDLKYLIDFVAVALAYPEEDIIIEGNVHHSVGDKEAWDTENVDQLGYTRALVIKNDLIKRGIAKERITIYNNRNEKPLNLDLSKDSVALNRRSEVYFSQFMYKEIDTK